MNTTALRQAAYPTSRALAWTPLLAAGAGLLVVAAALRLLDSRPGPGGGRGLAGLRERTAAAGGTLSAEPSPSGGFELCVTLPLSGAA